MYWGKVTKVDQDDEDAHNDLDDDDDGDAHEDGLYKGGQLWWRR